MSQDLVVPFDPTQTAKEIVDSLEAKKIKTNIAIDNIVLIDCKTIPNDPRGFKIILDAPYPDGKPTHLIVFEWNESSQHAEPKIMVNVK